MVLEYLEHTEIDRGFIDVLSLASADHGSLRLVRELLSKYNADVNFNVRGLFPLLMASQNGHPDVVKELLSHGADVNAVHEDSGAFSLLIASHTRAILMWLRNSSLTMRTDQCG